MNTLTDEQINDGVDQEANEWMGETYSDEFERESDALADLTMTN